MIIAALLFLLLIIYGICEYQIHKRNVNSIPVRILINGTRGKTSVARLIIYSLMEDGKRVMGRTTGSSAEMIFPDGRVEKIERKRPARILEMVPFFKKATEEKVDYVVIECMALQEENQKTMADTLVRPGIVAITNTYIDHVPEMGRTREETAWCLSRSVPRNAELYVVDDYYNSLSPHVYKVDIEKTEAVEGSIPIHPASWAISKAILASLGVSEDVMMRAKDKIPPDIGLLKKIEGKKGSLLIPTFSVNDKECMASNLLAEIEEHKDFTPCVIFNTREDREHRIVLMKEVMEENNLLDIELVVIGEWKEKAARYFRRHGIKASQSSPIRLAKRLDEEEKTLFVGLGNIKGEGEELIALALKEDN